MPSFFESVVSLIVKTSTDLPPDVRAAMKHARETEDESTRAGQALSIIGQNIDQAAEIEGATCQDTGMPTFEVKTPVGANQIWMKEADQRGNRRSHQARQAASELRGFAHRREQRQQPRSRHAGDSLRAVGAR